MWPPARYRGLYLEAMDARLQSFLTAPWAWPIGDTPALDVFALQTVDGEIAVVAMERNGRLRAATRRERDQWRREHRDRQHVVTSRAGSWQIREIAPPPLEPIDVHYWLLAWYAPTAAIAEQRLIAGSSGSQSLRG